MFFQDHENVIIISNGRSTARIPRLLFLQMEPGYALPVGAITRYFNGAVHWVSDGINQIAVDDSVEVIGYINKIGLYKSQTPPTLPPAIQDAAEMNWQGLESDLRGSAVWARAFDASARSTRANAFFTLILTTLTTTHILNDFKFAWAGLRETMQTQVALSDFSNEEIEFIRQTLIKHRFNLTDFALETL